jgi:hypothetical protein
MKWFNLKENKCPKCNKDWSQDLVVHDKMLQHLCGFKISEKKYREIVTSMVNKDIEWNEEDEAKFYE